MAPYIRKARLRRFKRFRYSLKFLTWLERQALRVGMPARTLYNDYLVGRRLGFEQIEGLPNGLPGGGVGRGGGSGVDYSQALVYFDANTPFTGTASDVTAIRYAMQQSATDYRTLTDANSEGYCAHRGLIRTTLTRTVTWGGQAFAVERWVPSFEVTV